jgi:ubiquinone/menaquinone biosynthesis C-methylase UbiE
VSDNFVVKRWQRLKYLKALSMVKAGRSKVVLDLGCGSGSLLRYLSRVFDDMVGLEIDMSYLREIAPLDLPSTSLLRTDGRKLPFRSKSVDIIYSIGVLEHVDHVQECVVEVHRVLRKRGSFIIGSPVESGLALALKTIFNKLVVYESEENVSFASALKTFSMRPKTERTHFYHVGKDSQFGHIGYHWEDMLSLVREHFGVENLKFFPFDSLKTMNPYVFFQLVRL